MKKKILTLMLAGMTAFALTACGGSQAKETKAPEEASQTAEAQNTEANQQKGDSAGGEDSGLVEEGKLFMVTNAEFPPYEFHDANEIKGIDVEIAEAIAEKLGAELEIEDIAFSSVILEVASGKADMGMAGISVTEDRKMSVDFTNTYAKTTQVIIVNEDSDIKGPDDLEGKTIGVQEGTTGDILLDDVKDANAERYNKGVEAVQSLMQKKIDAVVIDQETAKVFTKENSGIKILDEVFVEEEYAIAVKKGNTVLLDKINKALEELKAEGKIDEIVSKYINAE